MDQQTISWVFSGIGITVILSVFKFIFVPYPIISITLEEKAFLSGYHRFIRRLFIEFSAMIFLMYWSLLLPYPTQQSLPTWIILISGILLFILLSFFLVISWSEKILVTYLQKIKKVN